MFSAHHLQQAHHNQQYPTAPKIPAGSSTSVIARVAVSLCLVCLLCTGAVAIGVVVATHAPSDLTSSLTGTRGRIQAEDVVIAGAVAGAHAGAAAGGRVGSERRKRSSQLLEHLAAVHRGEGELEAHFGELFNQEGDIKIQPTLRVLVRALAEIAAEISESESPGKN